MIRHRSAVLERQCHVRVPCFRGEAVRVLTKPFPIPAHLIHHVKVRKNPSGRLGVKFVWDGRKGSRVRIGGMGDGSALNETDLKVGHSVIAINSSPVLNPVQASNLIAQSSGPEVCLTALGPPSDSDPPFCKLVTAPTSKEYPGISFDSTRNRCLVQVSRVFSHGPFAGCDLRQGDIVLAVNGIPVSKPEEADAVLRQSVDAPNTILYVVDMAQYRQSILKELQITDSFQKLRFDTCKNSCDDVMLCLAFGTVKLSALDIDYEQQQLNARDFISHSKKKIGRVNSKACSRLVQQFLEAFNSRMDQRMRILEEAVYCEAWNHGIQNANSKVPGIRVETSTELDLQVEPSPVPVNTAELEPPFASVSFAEHEPGERAPHLQAVLVRYHQHAASTPC